MQALVDQGHWLCGCPGLRLPTASFCPACRASRPSTTSQPSMGRDEGPADAPVGVDADRRPQRAPKKALNQQAAPGQLGSLADWPDQCLTLVVHGTPISQGSANAVAKGVLKRDNGPALVAWRDKITAEAFRVCGRDWTAANTAVNVDFVFTVPLPDGAPRTKPVPATGHRDLDKLVRAVGDALCPSIKEKPRFRVLASDMRITRSDIGPVKTHPRPLHTHPMALNRPGIVIRVTPAIDPVQVVPNGNGWAFLVPCPHPDLVPVSDQPRSTR